MNVLDIDVKWLTDPIRRSAPCMIAVSITNRSEHPVVISTRLAVGYEDSDSRELYFQVFRRGSEQPVGHPAVLYHRAPAGPEDYGRLASGDSVTTRIDLFEWVEVPAPGDYDLQVFYQADEPLSAAPKDLLGSVHKSPRFPFTVVD